MTSATLTRYFPRSLGELPDAGTHRAVQSLTRVLMAIKNLKGGYGYKSDGVKLGDADKMSSGIVPRGQPNTAPFTATCTRRM